MIFNCLTTKQKFSNIRKGVSITSFLLIEWLVFSKLACTIFYNQIASQNSKVRECHSSKLKNRPLTQGEIAIAYSVFGDTLDTSNIRIKTAWWVLKNYAVSPNGNIYFNKHNWIDDFSEKSLGMRGWLIHELTHVWQIQRGIKVFRKALFNRKYDYVLTAGKPVF